MLQTVQPALIDLIYQSDWEEEYESLRTVLIALIYKAGDMIQTIEDIAFVIQGEQA